MIGILTFHCTDNYGAVLQAYALQKQMSDQFPQFEVSVIDYRCKETLTETKLWNLIKKKGLAFAFTHFYPITSAHSKFESFRNRYFKLTKPYFSAEELENDIEQYEYIISGSDQVWNLNWSGNDTAYFQAFHSRKGKKLSYAASFGFAALPERSVGKYQEYLSDFQSLSVREASGKRIIENQLGLHADVHMDPTLLLTREQWENIAVKPKKKKYILVYMVPKQDSVIQYAIQWSKRTGLPIIVLSQSRRPFSVKHVVNASPEEFLGWFADAEYIVTNSFHGTVFSILFHKPFFLELHNPRGMNVRSKELLDLCHISYDDEQMLCLQAVDWEQVEIRLQEEREHSRQYFQQVLG